MSIVIRNVRLSYCNILEPRYVVDANGQQKAKWSACLLVPKTNTEAVKAMQAAVEAARTEGAQKLGVQAQRLGTPVHDGDGQMPKGGEYGPECKNCWVVNASSSRKPGVVDQMVQPILNAEEVYSGMIANVEVNFYPYAVSGNRGIACGLNNVQKVCDADRLDGSHDPASVFTPVGDNMVAADDPLF